MQLLSLLMMLMMAALLHKAAPWDAPGHTVTALVANSLLPADVQQQLRNEFGFEPTAQVAEQLESRARSGGEQDGHLAGGVLFLCRG